jgi:hypothetical protein
MEVEWFKHRQLAPTVGCMPDRDITHQEFLVRSCSIGRSWLAPGLPQQTVLVAAGKLFCTIGRIARLLFSSLVMHTCFSNKMVFL